MLNILALGISILSLVITALLAARQGALMRHTNELPLLVEFSQEFRSQQFQEAETYVLQQLSTKQPVNLGISNLPDEAKLEATTVATFFATLGVYVAFGLADEKIAVSIFGYRTNRAWVALEPYILRERILRNDDLYAGYFEDLVCRIRDNWPPSVKYGLEVQRLRDEKKNWRANSVLPEYTGKPRGTSGVLPRSVWRLWQR